VSARNAARAAESEALRIFRERGFDLLLFVLDLSIYWTAVAQLELAVGKELRQ